MRLYRLVLPLAILLLVLSAAAADPAPRTVDYVLGMLEAGLDQETIIARLDENQVRFRVAAGDISRLRDAGATDRLIEVVVREGVILEGYGDPGSTAGEVQDWSHPRRIESTGTPDGTGEEVEVVEEEDGDRYGVYYGAYFSLGFPYYDPAYYYYGPYYYHYPYYYPSSYYYGYPYYRHHGDDHVYGGSGYRAPRGSTTAGTTSGRNGSSRGATTRGSSRGGSDKSGRSARGSSRGSSRKSGSSAVGSSRGRSGKSGTSARGSSRGRSGKSSASVRGSSRGGSGSRGASMRSSGQRGSGNRSSSGRGRSNGRR